MKKFIESFFQNTSGGGLVEYSLILFFFAITVVAVLNSLGVQVTSALTSVVTAL